MGKIVQGDNGTVLRLTVKEDGNVVDLTGASVDVVIKHGDTLNSKSATIADALAGKCEVELTSGDVVSPGIYFLQATVKFDYGLEFSSDVQKFTVGGKLAGSVDVPTSVIFDGGEF